MNSKVFWILSAKLFGGKGIGVGDSDTCVLMKEIVVDMIEHASNLMQIKCFSANGRDKVAYLQSNGADVQLLTIQNYVLILRFPVIIKMTREI